MQMEENRGNVDQLLLDAALNGDVAILRDLVDRDPLLLLRRPSKIRPLHISSKSGHLDFTAELLRLNPTLAEELDPTDMSSPLHLASGNGHVGVVKALVSTNPCVCVARDAHGRNPAHVAAMKGHVPVLRELIRAVPAVSKERVGGGGGRESILHLCVKYNQLEALRAVVEMAPPGDAGMLLNAKDGDGNTILHRAMADQRLEIMEFLLDDDRVDKNTQNEYGWTPKDISQENKKIAKTKNRHMSIITFGSPKAELLSSKDINRKKEKEKRAPSFSDQRNSLMVVASVVATMAFQAGLTPPFTNDNGELNTALYKQFLIGNSIGMASSMSSMILLISGLPGRRFFVALVIVLMCMAVSSMAYTYAILLAVSINKIWSVTKVNSDKRDVITIENQFVNHFVIAFVVWGLVMVLIFIWHLVKWTRKLSKRLIGCLRRLGKKAR